MRALMWLYRGLLLHKALLPFSGELLVEGLCTLVGGRHTGRKFRTVTLECALNNEPQTLHVPYIQGLLYFIMAKYLQYVHS